MVAMAAAARTAAAKAAAREGGGGVGGGGEGGGGVCLSVCHTKKETLQPSRFNPLLKSRAPFFYRNAEKRLAQTIDRPRTHIDRPWLFTN